MSSSQDAATAVGEDGLRIWSCVTCRRRKVRCDRLDPCQNCQRLGIECHFPVTGRLPRRARPGSPLLGVSEHQAILLGRVRRLESLVTEMAQQLHDASVAGKDGGAAPGQDTWLNGSASAHDSVGPGQASSTNQTSDDYDMISRIDSELNEDFGKLVVGQEGAMHIGKEFWSVFCSEVQDIFEAVQDPNSLALPSRVTGRPEDAVEFPSEQDFVLQQPDSFLTVYDSYPSSDQASLLWHMYSARVDPFFKALHKPSVDAVIQALDSQWGLTLEEDKHPLVLAIALAAVTSLDSCEAFYYFKEDRGQLLARYRIAAEQALSKVGFLTTTKVEVLQGFAIYVYSLWLSGKRQLAWSLAGSLTRAAVAMGLHQDPECRDSSVSVVQAEVQRRLWWTIHLLESNTRIPVAPDLSIPSDVISTRFPLDVDDERLTGTNAATHAENNASQVTLTLIHCDLAELTRSLRTSTGRSSLPAQLQVLYTKKAKLTEKYLERGNSCQPFDALVETMTDLFFANAELVIYSQGHTTSALGATTGLEADLMLTPAVAVLEHSWSIMSNAEWKIWRCHFATTSPLKALGIVLNQVVNRPADDAIKTAWLAADKVVGGCQSMAQGDEGWKKLLELHARARIKMSA